LTALGGGYVYQWCFGSENHRQCNRGGRLILDLPLDGGG